MDILVEPGVALRGEIKLPGDKSISHRAIMCASLASGTSIVRGFLESEDCLATIRAFQNLGIDISKEGNNLKVKGNGLHGLKEPLKTINFGNSGTSMRLTAGILSGQNFDSVLTGDESLLRRPMNRIADPLNLMGFSVKAQRDGTPPLVISKANKVSSIDYDIPIASAQVKSCLMFAALYAKSKSTVKEKVQTRDHTERMFQKFGIPLEISISKLKKKISLRTPKEIEPCDIKICSDFSSAAFFILAALISPGSHIVIKNVGINNTRIGFLLALKDMGGSVNILNISNDYEPYADIEVKSSKLKGINLNSQLVPNLIDELPVLFIAAALAEGTTKIRGAEELRFKESDRLKSMAHSLGSFGVSFSEMKDGMDIIGKNGNELFEVAEIDSFGDHRIAMASVIGALRSKGICRINNCENISTSFPGFFDISSQIGINIKEI